MRVIEIFHSLQGEGMLVGVPGTFVRFAGCPLRCHWCDTKHAWDFGAGEELETAEIVRRIGRRPSRFVVLTGGEPMVDVDGGPRPGLVELTQALRKAGNHVTIETTGIRFVPGLACDLMSISPKLSNAQAEPGASMRGNHAAFEPDVVRRLIATYPYQVKFVVLAADDVREIQENLSRIGPLEIERVLLMPEARTKQQYLRAAPLVAELCRQTGFRFGPRLQTLLWDNERGR